MSPRSPSSPKSPFFPKRPETSPTIYAYEDTNPQYDGLLKVGYTSAQSAEERVAQQYPTKRPGKAPYKIVLIETAMREDGSSFTDHDVHRYLRARKILNPNGEWFKCTLRDVKSAVVAIRERRDFDLPRTQSFAMRPEQEAAVAKTMAYFKSHAKESPAKTPHFLWNAKMRFGKTFTAYQLARAMGWRKILVLTFKPAVQNAWKEDLEAHVDFDGWRFVDCKETQGTQETKGRSKQTHPLVAFGSFQDLLGKNKAGGIKAKNEWVHSTNWDCVILDEYHYGAWRENAKDLFEVEDKREEGTGLDYYDESNMPITTGAYLYLSGTPFRAIASGEFIEEQIYNWTYSDEQRAKGEWQDKKKPNPYGSLPRMVMLTYQLPDAIKQVAEQGEFNEFDLNEFFKADGDDECATFRHEGEVQKWLDLIRGAFMETTLDNLKLGAQKPPMPFSDARLLGLLTHTFWFLPSVASCHAMRNLIAKRQNTFYHDYNVIVAAGGAAGIGVQALFPVFNEMDDPLKTKTITLSCGKLTTGVTVRPWSGIFMLRNSSSPETYFQAAFRVQSPWVAPNPDGTETVLKDECYVFDFAPDRALRQIADYSCRLDISEDNPEKKVAEFISFLPVLAYDGSSMKQIDAAGILDMAMSGTTATLLARRWESALLVNVDNNTLRRLMGNEKAMQALMSIEGFRSLNQDIETIINKSESVKKLKAKASDEELSAKEKRQLTEEEKQYKSVRKQIQEKLIKFATRIPIFMYLTDYRECCLRDVITQLEPGLFRKVTGLEIKDFELLVSLDVFNSALMNDAVYKFKRYEDASLEYAGINRHAGEAVGLYDTVVHAGEMP
ncbi:MAG: GIY-YIG nuclease family protein [Kiritimatiellaeota bacterium]|nr:GIY-YIG nuclease family protein [Kiritimatiellota bacterium]